MKDVLRILRLLSDETRLRILLILMKRELCVYQIMAVLGVSQPLISRNLALLDDAGLVNERKEGRFVFYSLRKDMPSYVLKIIKSLAEKLKEDSIMKQDIETLRDCQEYQKKIGECDMRSFLAFMEERRRNRRR